MRIECICCDGSIAELASEWRALWRRLPDATPFQSPDWLLAWWRHFGTGMPRMLTARRDDALVGVLPLYELHDAHCRKLLPIGVSLSDYVDALVDPEVAGTADALLQGVTAIVGWQECHLPDLPPRSMLGGAHCPAGVVEQRSETEPCPVLQLPSDPHGLGIVVPRKTLRDLRQAASRSAAAGGSAVEQADRDQLADFMDNLFLLHEKRWRSRGEEGVCADPNVRAFHREAARALADAGMLRLYRLRIGGAVAAAYYGFTWRDRSYAYLGGFDPDLPRLSPGARILHHAIAEAIAEGASEFHFLRGRESYKYGWGAVDRYNSSRTLRRA